MNNGLLWLVTALLSSGLTLLGFFILLKKFGRDISEAFNMFGAMFEKPTVKRAMSIIGSQGGNAKAVGEIQNKLAKGFITKNYGMVKILAEKLGGIDVDELIDEYGAENIIQAIQQFAPMLGVDLSNMSGLLGQGLNKTSEHKLP